jgi:hypothetical protein
MTKQHDVHNHMCSTRGLYRHASASSRRLQRTCAVHRHGDMHTECTVQHYRALLNLLERLYWGLAYLEERHCKLCCSRAAAASTGSSTTGPSCPAPAASSPGDLSNSSTSFAWSTAPCPDGATSPPSHFEEPWPEGSDLPPSTSALRPSSSRPRFTEPRPGGSALPPSTFPLTPSCSRPCFAS